MICLNKHVGLYLSQNWHLGADMILFLLSVQNPHYMFVYKMSCASGNESFAFILPFI